MVNDQNRSIGYALRDGQGKLLRRFVVARGSKMDQWSYYQDGFEVYRENDLDGDQSLDECRWLNAGGTRIATVEKGKIAGWKQISAEEASKVFVQALARRDDALAARDGHGDARRAGGRRGAQGRRRQGGRGAAARGRAGRRPAARSWSAGTSRPSGTGSTARFRT